MNTLLTTISQIIASSLLLLASACQVPSNPPNEIAAALIIDTLPKDTFTSSEPLIKRVYSIVPRNIPIREYFEYMDSLLVHWDSTLNYPMTEHILVQHNAWLIDTLAHTDYYYLRSQNIFNKDPQALLALRQGDTLQIPSLEQQQHIHQRLKNTWIDINVPEFKLRIIDGHQTIYTFSTRVGQNKKRYLAMANREVDLKTRIGKGRIVRINRTPSFINPRDNKKYTSTLRDDGMRTGLPRAPWIEPELNGIRHGQLIHPTTNPATLGKAYSNGCIGVKEGDMWRIYYHAPLETRVVIRYDLDVVNEQGDSTRLPHIYPTYPTVPTAKKIKAFNNHSLCDCRS